MSTLVEDLHTRAFIAAIAHDKLARVAHHRDLARIPQLAFFATRRAEHVLEVAVLVEHLNAMVVRVGHDDLLVDAEAESVRRVELSLASAEHAEFRAYLHVRHLGGLTHRRVQVAVAAERASCSRSGRADGTCCA